MRNITRIIIHCTATRAGQNVTVAEIDKWHRARGFRGIGYHYVIYLDGTIHQGRSESATGAHCKGFNTNSIGICYVGGLDNNGQPSDTRTEIQRKAMHALIETLRQRYPKATIHGHYEFAAKACPCFNVKKEFG